MAPTPRGYPIFTGAQPPAGMVQMQLLAESIDADVATVAKSDGGVFVGNVNEFGQVAIPHALGVVPSRITVAMIGPISKGGLNVNETTPRDYGVTIYSISSINIIVRCNHLRSTAWAGGGGTVGVAWTARP